MSWHWKKNIQDKLKKHIICSTKEKYDGQLNNDFLMGLYYSGMVIDAHFKLLTVF